MYNLYLNHNRASIAKAMLFSLAKLGDTAVVRRRALHDFRYYCIRIKFSTKISGILQWNVPKRIPLHKD